MSFLQITRNFAFFTHSSMSKVLSQSLKPKAQGNLIYDFSNSVCIYVNLGSSKQKKLHSAKNFSKSSEFRLRYKVFF